MFGHLLRGRADAASPVSFDPDAGRSARQRRRATCRAVGVELSAGAIRAAYVDGDRMEVAEIPLPEGTVVAGEIANEYAAGVAMRRLWEEHHFPTKTVVLGIASPDIVTRPVVLPPMSAKDVRSALPFELADMVPFPIGDAVIDALPMDGYPTDGPVLVSGKSSPPTNLLAVVALQSTLRRAVSVAEKAGLTVATVEPPAFALVRAAGRDDVISHAVVHLGEDTLAVAVHRCGVLQFYRNVLTRQSGSYSSSELEAELVFIEQFRRKAAGAEALSIAAQARDHPLVAAIRGTLEYAATQPGAISVDAVTLAGDAQRCEEVATALRRSLAIPVNVVPMVCHGPAFTTAVGLALVPDPASPYPRRLDLLPRSVSATSSPRGLAIRAGAAAVGTALVLGGLTVTLGPDTGAATERLEAARVGAAGVDGELRRLAGPLSAAQETASLTRSLEKVTALGVDWARLTQEIRLAAPADVQVVSIDAKGPDPKRSSRGTGTITVRGQAPNQTSITTWLDALAAIKGVKRPWLASAATGSERTGVAGGFTTFTITMDLTDEGSGR